MSFLSSQNSKFINKILNYFLDFFWPFATSIVVCVFFSLYFFVLLPKYTKINEALNNQRTNITTELKNKKNFLDTLLTQKKKKLESIDKYNLDKLQDILPKEKSIARSIKEFDIIVKESNFMLENIRYADAGSLNDEFGNFGILKFSITISGGEFEDLQNFLKMAANNVNIMDVVGIRFNKSDRYDLEINTYYN